MWLRCHAWQFVQIVEVTQSTSCYRYRLLAFAPWTHMHACASVRLEQPGALVLQHCCCSGHLADPGAESRQQAIDLWQRQHPRLHPRHLAHTHTAVTRGASCCSRVPQPDFTGTCNGNMPACCRLAHVHQQPPSPQTDQQIDNCALAGSRGGTTTLTCLHTGHTAHRASVSRHAYLPAPWQQPGRWTPR